MTGENKTKKIPIKGLHASRNYLRKENNGDNSKAGLKALTLKSPCDFSNT